MARKTKYQYNPETLRYEPWRLRGKALRHRMLIFMGLSLGVALAGYFAYMAHFGSLEENILEQKNLTLKAEWQILEERMLVARRQLDDLIEKDDDNYRVILDSSPLDPAIREAGIGGSVKMDSSALKGFPLLMKHYRSLSKLKHQLDVEEQSYDQLNQLLADRMTMWASRPAIQPINNKELTQLHTTFGMRYNRALGITRPHKGLDFTADIGTPVYATGDGKVITAHRSDSYGNVVYIDHGFRYETRYAHLSRFNVQEGDVVKRGQVIGFVGNSGVSVGPHLHYEVLFQGNHVNPINFFQRDLSNREYEKLIEVDSKKNVALD